MSGLQAVLFDMDGTLCDTEPAWMACETRMAASVGATWTVEDGLALVGNNLVDSGRLLKERFGLAETPEQIVEQLVNEVIDEVKRSGVEWRPGALELVRTLNDAGIPVALVTMSYRRFAQPIVDQMPYGVFDAIGRSRPARRAPRELRRHRGLADRGCVGAGRGLPRHRGAQPRPRTFVRTHGRTPHAVRHDRRAISTFADRTVIES